MQFYLYQFFLIGHTWHKTTEKMDFGIPFAQKIENLTWMY